MKTALYFYRAKANVPQWIAAQKVGISNTVLSLAENGRRELSEEVLQKLSILYGVEIEALSQPVEIFPPKEEK